LDPTDSTPQFVFNTFNLTQLTNVPQNFSTIPPAIEKFPLTTIQQLLLNNISLLMQTTFNVLVKSVYGNGGFILVALPPAPPVFWYRPTSLPQFLEDTLIIEINGDIALFEPGCEIPHPLPSPSDTRKFDFELEISGASPLCILNQLSSLSSFISAIMSGQLLAPPLSFTYAFPFNNNSYSFVPATNSSKFTINPIIIDLNVNFLNGSSPTGPTPAILFNASLEIESINLNLDFPSDISLNASANLNSLAGSVAPGWSTPYSDQIDNENWGSFVDLANGYIHSLPMPLNFPLPALLENYAKDVAFDVGDQWVTIRANIK